MKAIIIGANGFLGSRLCDFLIENNHEVIAVINKNQNRINPNSISIPYSDIYSIDRNTINAVFYLSGSFSNTHEEMITINCKYLIDISEYFNKSKLVYISSTNVYGEHDSIIKEDTFFNNPNVYGLSKIAGEFIVRNHFKYSILRLCYLYGPGLENNSFLPRILKEAINENKITLFGKGERRQDYLYVDDAAKMCFLAFEFPCNDLFLGATGKSFSNKYIADLIMDQKKNVKLLFTELELRNSLYFDPSNTFRKLNWIPEVSIEQGLKRMLNASIDMR